MKNNILKSIFLTILLLLGVSHAAWGDFYIAGDNALVGCGWCVSSEKGKMSGSPASVTFRNIPAGTYQFKLTNGEQWGGTNLIESTSGVITSHSDENNTMGGNMFITTNEKADITFTITDANNWKFSITAIKSAQYYFMGTGIDGAEWGNGKQLLPSTSGMYEYIQVAANKAVEFKITPKSDGYDGELNNSNVNHAFYGDVDFNSKGSGNIKINSQSQPYYIIVYYPSTVCNNKEKAIVCASTTLPDGCPSSSYTVTFDMQEHGEAIVPQNVTSGGKATEPAAPTATGFTFGGWYTTPECTGDVYDFANTTVTGNITLYAKWTENKYPVTITAGAGGIVSPNGTQQVGTTPVTITAKTDEGYDFVNWTSTGGAKVASTTSATTTVTATAAGTVTANFQKSTYTVTFNANGHGEAIAPQKVTSGEKATVPTSAPTAAGFIFGGWYTEAECTNKYDFSTAVTKNITLYAKWTEDYSTKEFWYFDQNNARNNGGNTWPDTEGDGLVDKWKMTNTATYAYIYVENSQSENRFKIGSANWDVDHHLIANDQNIAESLAGDITLIAKNDKGNGESWHNIWLDNYSGSYYVVLYYPNVAPNTKDQYQVAAMKELPNMEKYKLTFGVIGENGNLTAKSGGVSISSGAEVASVTLTAKPTDNYEVAGWYSDAEGNNKINAAGTNTTYNLTLTTATSVYVKFKRIEKTYWYNGSDKGWTKGNSVALTNHANGVYAYYQHDAHSNDEVQFCIFEANSWDDKTPKYNGNHKNNGFYGANIDLGTAGDGNAIVPKQNTDYFIILYFPNTTINPNDNYILCASTTLPKLTDPVTVSFGVVGKTGGSLTAKSGNSTIESGTAVSYVTFTATPIAGYAVEGWYSDAEGTQKIADTGTKTTYTLSPVTVENCNVYVKFKESTTETIFFKNNGKWQNVYIYTFAEDLDPWSNDKNSKDYQGDDHTKAVRRESAMEQGKMGTTTDGLYYFNITNPYTANKVAFTWNDQSNNEYFYDTKVIWRTDRNRGHGLSLFVPSTEDLATNGEMRNRVGDVGAWYHYKGIWMKPNSKDAGYQIAIHTVGKNDHTYNYFTTSAIGGYDFSFDTVLTKGTMYSFFIKNDNEKYFGRGSDAMGGNAITATTKGWEMYAWGDGNVGEVSVTPAITGTYTFTIHLGDGKVLIDVIYPENEYRLVYVEKSGSTTEKYHPSHVIKQRAGGTLQAPLYDTISMHVRPKIRKWNEANNKYEDPKANPNTCEVQLQKRKAGESTWTMLETINAKTQFTESGVYNFVLKQVGEAVTLPKELIHPYTGQYYILTDAFDSNWSLTAARDNIKQRFWYSNYADNKESFSHYCCKWTDQNTNLEFVVANDYSYCITDTLIRTKYEADHKYVDEYGKLNENANVRFMWQHYNNTTDRAYVGAGGSAVKLISTNSQITEGAQLNLDDQQNWVYAKDVHAKINTRVKIEAFYHDYTQYFKGKKGEFNEANTEYLIKGIDTSEPYKIRVIYDFKTNHLICAWMPEGVISGDQVIESDIMLIRKDTCDATQITFNGANLKSVKTAYGVVELTKAYLGNANYTSKARANYWISFPFDVNLSDVFGNGTYGTHFGVQYYDGAERAEKGQWVDSPTRWKFYKDPTNVVLKKGLGYVLVVLPDKLLNEQFTHGNSSIRFYFPSTNTEPINIDGTVQEVIVPEHKCTIERNTRYIYDSNWNIIGVPTWANRDDMGNPKVAEQEGKWNFKVGFYYKADTSNGKFEASVANELSFKSMYAYLVQWAGTINWMEVKKPISGDVHPNSPAQQALQARRNSAAEEGEEELSAPEQYTLRLTLHRGEQQLDHTYVRLQEGNVTTDFDLNYDMTKIINSGANIYSLVGTKKIQCAANVQPLQEEARTISIPLGVVADQDGLYTFSLPEGTEGMNVSIADFESGTVHNLALGDYQTALTKGTYEGRFALEIQPRQGVSTGCEQTDAAGKSLRKVLINGNLYILRDGKAYTATGNEL